LNEDNEGKIMNYLRNMFQKTSRMFGRASRGISRRDEVKRGLQWVAITILLFGVAAPLRAQEVIVFGSQKDTISFFEADKWWTNRKRGQQLKVPHAMIVAVAERWQKNAPKLPVSTKKDIFFSALLPLVVHANTMVLDRRSRLQKADAKLARGDSLSAEEVAMMREMTVLLRIAGREKAAQMTSSAEQRQVIQEALYKLDVIPAGLVLAQAACESGYGTSRFTIKGNALFGQWTFGGDGLTPEQQRKNLGDYRISSFKWPFDSVRSYFLNLSSNPAYEDFRRIRADLRSSGKPLRSLALVEGLKNYSERGQAYVDTVKSVIQRNSLDIADSAVFRDEPMVFLFGAADQAAAAKVRNDIEAMRKSGELSIVIERMRLE
jgi:Bax protein